MLRGLVTALAVALLICSTAFAADKEEKECIELVDSAINFIQEKGLDYSLKVLNASSGPFRRGPIYMVVITFDGRLIAHPVNKDLLKVDQFTLKDANGKYFVKEMVEVAKNPGAGWVEFMWKRHGETQPVVKRCYIKRIPGTDMLLNAGYYPDKGSD